MSVRVYKTVKAVTQLVAVATGFYAIAAGADPLTTFALVAMIVSGPEAIETVLVTAEGSQSESDDDQE